MEFSILISTLAIGISCFSIGHSIGGRNSTKQENYLLKDEKQRMLIIANENRDLETISKAKSRIIHLIMTLWREKSDKISQDDLKELGNLTLESYRYSVDKKNNIIKEYDFNKIQEVVAHIENVLWVKAYGL